MSRVSSPSSLSPSTTGQSGSVDLGQKTQTSVSTGGIGVTREVANIGGMSVTGGVSVEVSPIRLDISGNVDYDDPTKNSVSIGAGAEIPGGLLGVSGGVTINTTTGAIEEVSIGGEVAGIGGNISVADDGWGFGVSLQIPFTPIEIDLGFEFPNEKKESPTPTPSVSKIEPEMKEWLEPRPKVLPPNFGEEQPRLQPPPFGPAPSTTFVPVGEPGKICRMIVSVHSAYKRWMWIEGMIYQSESVNNKGSALGVYYDQKTGKLMGDTRYVGIRHFTQYLTPKFLTRYSPGTAPDNPVDREDRQDTGLRSVEMSFQPWSSQLLPYPYNLNTTPFVSRQLNQNVFEWWGLDTAMFEAIRRNSYVQPSWPPTFGHGLAWWYDWNSGTGMTVQYFVEAHYCGKQESLSPSSPTPFPNPPPRKEKMDDCCKDTLKLLRQIRRFEQETMILLGRPLDPSGNLTALPAGTKYFGEQIERIKTPIKDINKPEKEKIKFTNFYELQMYLLKQQINLDVAVDPQSFVAPVGYLQNPDYQRDSEVSLESNIQPERDKLGNNRELEIGKDIKINSISQQQQYVFEALKRLEYLFPSGELSDAKFDKSLIIPGATGELKVHNLIHFQEFFAQYLNATLGDPKISIKMEDNNALKEGKQEAIFRHFSIAQMIRELYKITLESGDDINAIMETGIRDFRTNLANRIQIVQIAEMAQALIEDTGMLESQEFIPLRLDGDPYAGKWKAGMGFEPDADLDSNEEKATEKLMRATLKNFETQVKVIRRDKRENADIRDLLIQIAEMFIRSTSIPATKEGIEKALAAAKFKTQVDMALTRSQVKRAAAASRSRTKKRKKT